MRFLPLVFLPAFAYQCLAIASALLFRARARRKEQPGAYTPPVSVLKPVHGLDPNTYAAFVSQAEQRYPQFEVLFGVRDPEDAAVLEIQRLQQQFPQVDIRLIQTSTVAANAKVGTLIDLATEARHPVWVVNDGDIKVGVDYLRTIVAPLADMRVGVVTCPYRAWAHSSAAAWEALGIGTDFMLGVLVADRLGMRDYGLGATLAFRAADLQAAGGFAALADFIADDYQLGHRIAALGKPTYLCPYTVETALGEATWRGVWRHQLRWARTIRLSKSAGYLGVPIQHTGLWMLLAMLTRSGTVACALLAIRWCSAFLAAVVFENKANLRLFGLAPLWDLYAFAVWATSYAGNSVVWRGKRLRLDASGRIVR